MRKTFRARRADQYWTDRWSATPVDAPAEGLDRYPLLYANMAVDDKETGEVLELGCGPGRLLRYYHGKGIRIVGVDNVNVAVENLRAADSTLDVVQADARALPFVDGQFSVILCFGVFHSIELDVEKALREAFRVLRPGGIMCAEFRADNVHNLLIDLHKGRGGAHTAFHKWNYRAIEAQALLEQTGFQVFRKEAALNMPILYHAPFLRHASQRQHDEHASRASGYRLRPAADWVMSWLLRVAPDSVCNEHIFFSRKPGGERGSA